MHGAPVDIRTAGDFQNEINPSGFGLLDIDTPHSRPIHAAEVNLALGRLLIFGHPSSPDCLLQVSQNILERVKPRWILVVYTDPEFLLDHG